MIPTIGRIVHYTLSVDDVDAINRRRADALRYSIGNDTGCQLHFGNEVRSGQVFPMIITRVWGDDADAAVNGQVFLDGNDTLWVTSVVQGNDAREWVWPPLAPRPGS